MSAKDCAYAGEVGSGDLRKEGTAKGNSMKEQFIDCLGIPFARHTEWLAPSTRDWPQPSTEDLLPAVLKDWRSKWAGRPCWWCEQSTTDRVALNRGELHHLHAAGGKKVNEPWLFTFLCYDCHQASGEAVKASSLGRLLFLKWKHDARNVWWQGIALRLRRRLPDLVTDEEYFASSRVYK